ncbi:phytanoyl-CoA dioxygenase family protein [Chitinophaga alhagiae]|uniref:phytanoyl-CoA dioxygenase family protein n=1 Tax=Chitinophaga alhagiae TaxID=2203219 RepID=UPI000E5BF83F|nr:phytanoyl-CoA dioxygenase family protein [Chitinophaga alhagiae]
MHTAIIKETFQRDGYVLIPAFLDSDEVNEIIKNFERVIEQVTPNMPAEKMFFEDKDDPSTLKQLIDIHQYDQFFDNVLNKGKFKDIAALLLNDNVVGKTLEYFNKPPRIGKPTPPHQDGYYFMLKPSVAVTMWMALEPADEENGCVRYIKGSHLTGMRPHGRTQTLGFSQQILDYGPEDINKEISITAKPGDLLIHHSLTIHTAGGNKSATRSRKALGLIYFGLSAREDTEAKAAYQKKLQAERMGKP